MRKILSLMLVAIISLSCFSISFGAEEQGVKKAGKPQLRSFDLLDMAKCYSEELLPKKILEENNYIIIDSEEKAKSVIKSDLEEVTNKWSTAEAAFSKQVVNAFYAFCSLELSEGCSFRDKVIITDEKYLYEAISKSNKLFDGNYTNDMMVKDFCSYCFENQVVFSKRDRILMKSQVESLRANAAERLILDFFLVNDYPISYGLFLHSITSNPQNLSYSIEGITAHTVNCGSMNLAPAFSYEFLREQGFIAMIYNYSRRGSWEENTDGHHYEFNNGDLAYSIHGTTNMRLHRMPSTKTYFRIWDIYDFAGELATLLNLTTSTNPYGIIIEGSYRWD